MSDTIFGSIQFDRYAIHHMVSKVSIENEWYYTFTNVPQMSVAHIQFMRSS